jgi:hypothetical protein
MHAMEIHARATIAAALIVSRAVEVPTVPLRGEWVEDPAILRLRELTEYIYQAIVYSPRPTHPPQS